MPWSLREWKNDRVCAALHLHDLERGRGALVGRRRADKELGVLLDAGVGVFELAGVDDVGGLLQVLQLIGRPVEQLVQVLHPHHGVVC